MRFEGRNPIHMVVGPGEHRRPTRCADRVRAVGIVEPHPLIGDPIEVRCLVYAAAICADRVGVMVVGHDVDQVITKT